MNHKIDRDTYIIPPNFIESGTFFGGMFKARNVIEAGILAFAIGVPVFSLLPLSLTARIIALCLTALPAALVALIGVSGESLSSFLLIFIKYLRNRRIVGGNSAEDAVPATEHGGKHIKKKAHKPDKAPRRSRRSGREDFPAEFDEVRSYEIRQKLRPVKKQKPAKEKKAARQKKKVSKERKVKRPIRTQEPKPACLNPVADYLPISKIENGIIYTKDHRYVKVVEVVPINFMLRSAQEQRNIIYSFVSYLKISPIKLQIKVLTRRAEINRHLNTVRKEMEQETNEQCLLMQEDYLQFVQQIGSREAITRRFFLIFECEPWSNTKRSDEEGEAINALQSAVHTATNYLRQCGNEVIVPENWDEFTVDVLYNLLCRNESAVKPLSIRAQEVVAEYLAKGRDSEIDHIPATEFCAPKSIDFTHGHHICILAQLLGNYATWKQGGGIPGDGTSPLAASPDFLLCLSSVLRPPYGVYGILICIGLLAVLLIMVMRMGYGDAGEYDEDRNFSYSAKGTYGTSGWMSRKEMSGVLDLVPDLRKHKGVVLGMLDGKAVCIPEDTRINSNLAVYGASGSMKTRSFCMNRILQATVRGENGAGESLIICDPKSELYEKSSEFLRSRGYCVKVFNLVSPENSDSWCCLAEVEGQELMAQLFVDVIIKNTTNNGKSDHFWDACEMNLLKALVLYVDQGYAEENRNIGEVYRLLTLNGESQLDTLFGALPSTHPAKAPYSLFKQASDTVRSGVIIGLGSRLQVFQSELIKKITAKNEIDLELPGQQPCAYFLVTSDQDSTFDFLASLFLSFCFIKLVRYADHNCEGGKLPVPVHILGEELTACGTIPDLSRRLSVIRSRNISMSCVFQNLAGLQNRYPQNLWQEIIGNCDAQLFLGCTDQLTAEFISARTGLASVAVSSKSKQLGTWRISNYTPEFRETSGVGKRPVLTPDEVLRLPLDQALIIIRGKKVLQVDKMDYSKHPEAKYLRSCKASAHVPEWRRLEEEAAKTPQPAPKPAPAAKKPAKRKATKPASPIDKSPKEAPAPKSAGTPEGIITTDKDSILS